MALPDLLALAFLLGLALLLLVRQIALGGSFYNGDILLQSVPVYSWYAEALRQGNIPIWSPAILGGFPLAFAQYGFFYPPDLLLFRLLDSNRAFHLSLALHLALAGGCTYWYCRVLALRRLPSLLAAVAFQMGNEALAWPVNGFMTKTLFALPALLAIVELTFRRRGRWWLLVPLIVGAALLVGYAQFVLLSLMVAGAYAVVAKGERGTREIVLLAAGVAVGLGLAAVRVAPTLAVVALSTRAGGMALDRSSVDSIEPWALVVGNLLPAVFELSGRAGARPDYMGAPVLLLAFLSVAGLARLDRVARFHAGLAAAGTLLSLGSFTPLYGLLVDLPFFSYFRGPNRLSLVAALGIAVLAAYALDRRLTLILPRQRKWDLGFAALALALPAVGILAVGLSAAFQLGRDPLSEAVRTAAVAGGWDTLNALRPRVGAPLLALGAAPVLVVAVARGHISERILELSALGLSVLALFVLGWTENPWLPPAAVSEPPALLKLLKEDPDRHRIFSWAPRVSTYNVGGYYTGLVGRPPSLEFEERYLRQFLPPNLGMLFGIATADGYETLQTRRQALIASYMGSERVGEVSFSDGDPVPSVVQQRGLHDRLNLLAALNVRYLLHAFPIEDPRLEHLGEVEEKIYPDLGAVARVHLYRLRSALPRAFVVPKGVVMAGEREALETLAAGAMDARQTVILEGTGAGFSSAAGLAPGAATLTPDGSSVEIADYQDDRVVVTTHTDGSGFLVLMDFLMPGWTAAVDGRPAPILPANFAGRAVPIRGAGEHRIEFSYQAPFFREGLAVSLLSIALLGVLSIKAITWR